jgi:hypothetical protein
MSAFVCVLLIVALAVMLRRAARDFFEGAQS